MNIDEMKNRISMALKDPILQQGFEIICKENADLKAKNKWYSEQICNKECAEVWGNLDKAKELIKTFLDFAEAFGYSPSMDKFITDTKQFLKNDGCPDVMCEDCTKEDCGIKKLGLVEVEK